MHARLLIAQVSPEKIDELTQLWHDRILAAYKEQNGWKGARLLVDRQTGKAILMSVWEAEAEGRASSMGSAFAQQVHAIIGHLLTGRPVAEHYEIAGDA